jgi:hypothetical protein
VGQNGNGGHAHNDAGAYELHVDGHPVIVDPGTYAYTADPAARNAFRSTAAHATAQVAGEEINPIDPQRLFELQPLAAPSRLEWEVTAASVVLRVCHDGYRRLPQGVVHERRFHLDRGSDSIEINDLLRGEGSVEAVVRVPFAPGSEAGHEGDAIVVRLGQAAIRLAVDGAAPRLTEGWVSRSYGRRERAPLLELALGGALPLTATHRIEVLA